METLRGKRKLNKCVVLLLVTVLSVTSSFVCPKTDSEVNASTSVKNHINNPVKSNDVSTWDCVYFGHYNQTLNKKATGSDNYFREPIRWRVLEKTDDELLLMADESLESIQYNEVVGKKNPDTDKVDLSWGNSDLRKWLNDDFYNEAFNGEKEDIINTDVEGNNDNVYILSKNEALKSEYGFYSNTGNNPTRASVNTDYCYRTHDNKSHTATINNGIDNPDTRNFPYDKGTTHKQDYKNYKGCGIWWLRTPENASNDRVYRVDYNGAISGKRTTDRNVCVRPVIRVNADSEYLKYAGSVSSDGTEKDYCGDEVHYEFNTKTNTLRIFGSGPMYSFDDYEAPWHKYYEDIYTVVVEDQVTNVTANAFENCGFISYMYLSENVTEFSDKAFPKNEMTNNFLVSVEKNSVAHGIMEDLRYNYSFCRSKKPLATPISTLYNVYQDGDVLYFSFDNPMPGQSYEVYLNGNLYTVIDDDIDNSNDIIDVTVEGITNGQQTVNVNALVVGSNGLERRTAGKTIKTSGDGLSDPEWINREEELVKWDCVKFGTYPQSEIIDGEEYVAEPEDDKDEKYGTYTEDGKSYRVKPILWRILANEGDTLLLMADKSLDSKPFDSKNGSNDWESCTLRQWMNDSTSEEGFISRAFTAEEQAQIVDSTTAVGTTDKVITFSQDEVENESYGFLPSHINSKTRRANATDYCARNNDPDKPTILNVATDRDLGIRDPYDPDDTYHNRATIWWLIEKYHNTSSCKRVNYPGNTDEGKKPSELNASVRPIIRVKTSAVNHHGSRYSDGKYVKPAHKYTIKIDGKIVDRVEDGETYTLPKESNLMKTRRVATGDHLGYIDLDNEENIYRNGTSFEIHKDKEFKTLKVDVEHNGEAIRVSQTKPRGLAFRNNVTINDGDPIHSKSFQYGVMVTTYEDYYDEYDQDITPFTEQIPGHKLYNVVFKETDFAKNDKQSFTVAINNLKPANYSRKFIAAPYVIVTYANNGGQEVIYPSNSVITIRSAKESAESVMADTSKWPTAYKPWQRAIVEEYAREY